MLTRGQFDVEGGSVVVDRFAATNGGTGILHVHAGTVEIRSGDFSMGRPLVIGEGRGYAAFRLANGTNVFRNGLEIASGAELRGAGTVQGLVTNHGRIGLAQTSGGIWIAGDLISTPASGVAFEINGPPTNTSLGLTVTGLVSVAGNLQIAVDAGFSPSPTAQYPALRYGRTTGDGFANVDSTGRILTFSKLGSFRLIETNSAFVLTDYRTEDADGDGIQDSWAIQHFGLTPLPAGTAPGAIDGDQDGDGLSNREEFLLKTDPTDARSGLRATLVRHPSGHPALSFLLPPNTIVSIQHSPDLIHWTSVDQPDLTLDTVGRAEWLDDRYEPPSPRFYRIRVD